jgi:hypothetical protein
MLRSSIQPEMLKHLMFISIERYSVNFDNFDTQSAFKFNTVDGVQRCPLCKMFWLLSHKHYLIPSLLIDIMIMTSLLKEINIQDIKSFVSNDAIVA